MTFQIVLVSKIMIKKNDFFATDQTVNMNGGTMDLRDLTNDTITEGLWICPECTKMNG